jgi:hypothetical protein
MSIDPAVRSHWESIQSQNDVPVNALGMRIDSADTMTLKVWRDLGLQRFLKEPQSVAYTPSAAPAVVARREPLPQPTVYPLVEASPPVTSHLGEPPRPAAGTDFEVAPLPAVGEGATPRYYRGTRLD